MRTTRLLAVLIPAAAVALGESYPSAWNYVNPDSAVLIGFDWTHLRQSPLGEAAVEHLSGESNGMPDASFLANVNQILLALNVEKVPQAKTPGALLVMSGQFDLAALKKTASARAMRPAQYRTVLMMVESGKPWGEESVLALVSEQTLLFGDRKSIMQAIDRNAPNQPRVFSPALARAAHLAETHDLWIMSRGLSSRLANAMEGPLRVGQDITGIEAGISFHDGLDAEAALTAADEQAAAKMAQALETVKPQLPKALQDFGVVADKNVVHLALAMDSQQVAAVIGEFSNDMSARVTQAAPATPSNRKPVALAAAVPPHDPQPQRAAAAPAATPKKSGKMVIRIFGLDDGPKEIPYSDNQ